MITKKQRFTEKYVLQEDFKKIIHRIFQNKRYKTCLNVGSPTLQYNPFLKNYCEKITTIDLDPAHKEIIKMDALNTTFENNSFDLIFSNQVIEHILESEHENFFEEMLRIAKPEAPIVIITPNQFAPTRFIEMTFNNYLDEDHKKEFNIVYAWKIKRFLRKNGAKVSLVGMASSPRPRHKRLNFCWRYFPAFFKELAFKFPIFCRGFIFVIKKEGEKK